jgi:hypothetical protein
MITNPQYRVLNEDSFAAVRQNTQNGQKSLHAAVSFKAGDTIHSFSAGAVLHVPTYLTVQIATERHITLQPELLQYINHSCDPNVFFDTTAMQVVCLKPIQPGEEFTFFYPSTEWDMAQPFICQCGSANCLQLIRGAAHLSADVLQQYRLTDFIQQQLLKHRTPVSI